MASTGSSSSAPAAVLPLPNPVTPTVGEEKQIIKVSEFDEKLGDVPLPLCRVKVDKGNITTRVALKGYKQSLQYVCPEIRELIEERLPQLKFLLDIHCASNVTFPSMVVNLVMHALMNTDKKDPEFWFYINNMPVRFGLQEFCLVSGLSFNETTGFGDKEHAYSWAAKYFPDHKLGNNINVSAIESVLNDLKPKIKELTEEEKFDYARLLMVCLIGRMTFVKTNADTISMTPFGLLSDFEWANKFGWARYLWPYFAEQVGQEAWNKGTDGLGRLKYNMLYFPHIFLAWICEAIPHLGDQLGKPRAGEERKLPRLANWTWRGCALGLKEAAECWSEIKSVNPTLVPTEEEKKQHYWISFMEYRRTHPDQPLHPRWTALFEKRTVLEDDMSCNRKFTPSYNFEGEVVARLSCALLRLGRADARPSPFRQYRDEHLLVPVSTQLLLQVDDIGSERVWFVDWDGQMHVPVLSDNTGTSIYSFQSPHNIQHTSNPE